MVIGPFGKELEECALVVFFFLWWQGTLLFDQWLRVKDLAHVCDCVRGHGSVLWLLMSSLCSSPLFSQVTLSPYIYIYPRTIAMALWGSTMRLFWPCCPNGFMYISPIRLSAATKSLTFWNPLAPLAERSPFLWQNLPVNLTTKLKMLMSPLLFTFIKVPGLS